MGIDIESARFLLQSYRQGVCFERCLTLGRQHYFLGKRQTRRLFRQYGLPVQAADRVCKSLDESPYAEAFLEALGARRIESLDISDFEGATIVHDLNIPVPQLLYEIFDVVCDFGTLEHVFNFPQALTNCMNMVRVGGRLIIHTPANNYWGHGFYQFGPELFYRTLCPENGFVIERLIAVEYGLRRRWFKVADPYKVGHPARVITMFPVLIFAQARRIERVELRQLIPHEVAYERLWSTLAQRRSLAGGFAQKLFSITRELFPWVISFAKTYVYSSLNPRYRWAANPCFTRISKGS